MTALNVCALDVAGTVSCWGDANGLPPGLAPDSCVFSNCAQRPVPIPGIPALKTLAAGTSSCGLTPAGTVICWSSGRNPTPLVLPQPLRTLTGSPNQLMCGMETTGRAICFTYASVALVPGQR